MDPALGIATREALARDEAFFTALLAADHAQLDALLADDFLIIDVLGGQVVGRDELLAAIASGQLRFAEVTRHPDEVSVRSRDSIVVVVGRTRMVICHQGKETTMESRYTHVLSCQRGLWQLMSAQGTPTHVPAVSDTRSRLFCDTALAGRIERAEAQLIAASSDAARRRAATSGFVMPIVGAVASFAEAGSPFNKVAGLGFGGVPDATSLDEIERAFAVHGAPVQVELSQLADPAISAVLTARGYQLESFENVLGCALTDQPAPILPAGVVVRPSLDAESSTWLDVVADAVAHPDTQGVPWHEDFPREVVIAAERDMAEAGVVRYTALRNGIIVGGATMCLAHRVAQLTGAATSPGHRRRGVQTALLSVRLAEAAAAGCDVAVITTQPGSKSQQNAHRRGFDLLYARAVLVKRA